MRLRDDDRAQSVQIGAVLLFAMLVVAFSSYQAFVVPNQNRAVEFNHNQDIRDQMQDLRNELVSIHGETATRSVTLALGTRYPARLVAVNPGPASGTIRTSGTADSGANLTIANATASGETGDFWNGTGRRYDTGFLVYQPSYNVYGQAPETAYENTVLSNRFADESLAATGQTMIDGKRISLVTINGSLSRTQAGSTSLDLEPVSTSTTTVAVSNDSSNVTLSAATQLSESEWDALLADQRDENGGHVLDYEVQTIVDARYDRLSVTLEPNVSYRLRMTKVGVGSQVTAEDEAYLTDAAGNATRLETGDTTTVTLELRDAYNNPVTDGQINASAESGTLSPDQVATDENGQATFTYDSTGVAGGQWVDLRFSAVTEPATSFDGTTPRNVTMRVYVESEPSRSPPAGSGAYNVTWLDPSDQTGIDCPNGVDNPCTLDFSQTSEATLSMATDPIVDGGAVQYATNDTQVGTVSASGTTNAVGENSTTLTPVNNGGVTVYTSSGGGGDRLSLEIINRATLVYNDDAVTNDGPDTDSVAGGVNFSVTNGFGESVTITDVRIAPANSAITTLSDDVFPNDEPLASEVYVAADLSDAHVDYGGGTGVPRTVDLDTDGQSNDGNAQLSDGATATFYLYEFTDGTSSVDMSGEDVEITVTYQPASGGTETKTFTITPTDGSGGGGGGSSAPSATITSATYSAGSSPPSDRYDVTVDVSDVDGDLDRVEYEFVDSSGTVVDTATDNGVSGSSDTSTEQLVARTNERDSSYTIRVTVYDSASNTGSDQTVVPGSG
ncbi:Ig-like domain-containing protein [Halomicrobium sp. LC1Hm]|uniref:Ig-like domain-containing protein n=1 Tax=Halomicrobium sp. LC1Hm TaxID=2610902 RepID=UPI0012983856|nr:Ig-like domain-containing protein [Halomicrobium sp. LC1Hm]QGA82054.1 putative surface protein, possible component of pili like system [Halomicrobium sp. LC1Hm]